ncbi:hypothetical protein KCU61_g1710, partial [Aureobasidium melanogenum]
MNITRYRWSDCPHVQHVNDSGQPMSWVEVRDPVNRIVNTEPSHDCPACKNPEVTHSGISIMPRVPENIRQSAPAQTTPLNPVVNSFTPSQAIADPRESTTSANDHLAAQQALGNPYQSAVHANIYPAVHQDMVNPYASTVSVDNYLTAQQAMVNPYESTALANNDLAIQQDMINPYALTLPTNNYLAVQQPLDYQYQQQVYNSAGQTGMPSFYGPAGPMDFAGTIPTAGPTNQLAADSLHHASVNSNHNTKIAGKSPQHKPGKECPEGNANCHWHYTGWCHSNPATCPLALQAITASFHAHGEWRHAPAGWNEAHQSCIRIENPVMCPFHAQLARKVHGSSYN